MRGEGREGGLTAFLCVLLPLCPLLLELLLLDPPLLLLGIRKRLLLLLALLLNTALEPGLLLCRGVRLELVEEAGDATDDVALWPVGVDARRTEVRDRRAGREELEQVRGQLGCHVGLRKRVWFGSSEEASLPPSRGGSQIRTQNPDLASDPTPTPSPIHREVLTKDIISFVRVDLVLAGRVDVEPVAELDRQISRPSEVAPLERVRQTLDRLPRPDWTSFTHQRKQIRRGAMEADDVSVLHSKQGPNKQVMQAKSHGDVPL